MSIFAGVMVRIIAVGKGVGGGKTEADCEPLCDAYVTIRAGDTECIVVNGTDVGGGEIEAGCEPLCDM
jgi:hypothetical protein